MDGSVETRGTAQDETGDGALSFTADPPALHGWALPDPLSPDEPPEIGLDVAGFGTLLLVADAGRDGVRFALDWPLPPGLCDGVAREARAFHLVTGRELAGSPLRLASLSASALPSPAISTSLSPPLSLWRGGLAGTVPASAMAELAEGLHAGAQLPVAALRFEMLAAPSEEAGAPPRGGVRLLADAISPRISLFFRIDGAVPGETMPLTITAWLPEAIQANMDAVFEMTLQVREGAGFRRLRMLRQARIFRRPTEHRVELSVPTEEAEGGLWLGLEALGAQGLAALPPASAARLPEGAHFEDGRLAGTFARGLGFMGIHGGARAGENPILPHPLIPPPARIPARAAGGAHPFTQVIVPVYNGGEEVRECLRSLRAAATGPMQVVLVDDGSRDFTAEMLRAEAAADPRFVLHRRDTNRGYTKSINEGVMLTGADWVVVLNSDTLVPPGWLDRMHAAARTRAGTGMVGPLSNAASWQSIPAVKRADASWSTNEAIGPHHLPVVQALLDRVSERAYPEFPLLNGFCTMISRAVFDRVGLYDEDAFPTGYGEETDLCLRARAAGFRLTVADDTFVYHHKSLSFGKGRARLARAGRLEMTNKHAGVVVPALERMMQECVPLGRLRARLADIAAELN
ncbi:MAG: glycosyltransferase family 2 protein [Rubritepida sp.]|nr:glycosyltransferase family 2 protein [Rubritepida sp.]